MQPVLDDLIILLTDRNFTDLTTPNKEKKKTEAIKPHPAEPQSTYTQQNPQAWTLISTE